MVRLFCRATYKGPWWWSRYAALAWDTGSLEQLSPRAYSCTPSSSCSASPGVDLGARRINGRSDAIIGVSDNSPNLYGVFDGLGTIGYATSCLLALPGAFSHVESSSLARLRGRSALCRVLQLSRLQRCQPCRFRGPPISTRAHILFCRQQVGCSIFFRVALEKMTVISTESFLSPPSVAGLPTSFVVRASTTKDLM